MTLQLFKHAPSAAAISDDGGGKADNDDDAQLSVEGYGVRVTEEVAEGTLVCVFNGMVRYRQACQLLEGLYLV